VASSSLFEIGCDALQQASGLDRLAARGTMRLALKKAGLEVATLTSAQLDVVVKRLLPEELRARGIANPAAACENLTQRLAAAAQSAAPQECAPEDLFRRLRGA